MGSGGLALVGVGKMEGLAPDAFALGFEGFGERFVGAAQPLEAGPFFVEFGAGALELVLLVAKFAFEAGDALIACIEVVLAAVELDASLGELGFAEVEGLVALVEGAVAGFGGGGLSVGLFDTLTQLLLPAAEVGFGGDVPLAQFVAALLEVVDDVGGGGQVAGLRCGVVGGLVVVHGGCPVAGGVRLCRSIGLIGLGGR